MKLLLVGNGLHHKNAFALNSYKNILITHVSSVDQLSEMDLTVFDCVYSPALPICVSLYPTTRFLFGPHFSVLPDNNQLSIIKGNSVYIQPSEWAVNVWKNNAICNGLALKPLPFGVDTDRFCPTHQFCPTDQPSNKQLVFVYFKHRNPADLVFITNHLSSMGISFRIFGYSNRYSESEYLHYLQQSKYGIWVDAHESQGFALEEALSCNVPLLVWNVVSFRQEYGSNYPDVPATTVPYWDGRCGELFYQGSEFPRIFSQFLAKLSQFTPREYILENLTIDLCEQKMVDLIESMK